MIAKSRKKNALREFISDPLKMKKKVTLGIDIGAQSVKMVLFRRKGRTIETITGISAKRPAVEKKDDEWIEDVMPLIKESLKGRKEEINNVIISVQGSSVMVRRVEVPPMPRGELKAAIPWVVDRFLPYSIEDAAYDFKVLDKKKSGELEILVVVARREWINRLLSSTRKIGLPPSVVTVAPLAISNVLGNLKHGEEDVNVVIDIGERITSISFFSRDTLEFSRDIMTAGKAMTESLMGKVTYKGEEFSIDLERAEEIKCKYGIPLGETPEYTEDGIPFSSIQALVRPAAERLANEIDRSIKYAARNYGIDNVGKLWLTGGSAALLNLREYLSSSLGQPVETLDLSRELEAKQLPLEEEALKGLRKLGLSWSVAVGLALEKGDGINLITTGVQDIKRTVMEKKLLSTAAGIMALLLAGASVNMEVRKRVDTTKLKGMEMSWEKIRSDPSFQDIRNIQERMKGMDNLIKKVILNHDLTPDLLMDISHRIPEGVVLEDLFLVRRGGAGKDEDKQTPQDSEEYEGEGEETVVVKEEKRWELGMEGTLLSPRALSEPILSAMMLDLENSPFFRDPELIGMDEIEGSGGEAVEFSIKCVVIRPFEENKMLL